MNDQIDVTKLPGYTPSPLTNTKLIAVRHACGRVLFADLEGDYPIFYGRESVSMGHNDILLRSGKQIHDCPHCHYPLDMDWMRPLWLVRAMPYHLAVLTASRRVCSNCWGHVEITARSAPIYNEEYEIMEMGVMVLCPKCRYETVGYVSSYYVDKAKKADIESFEVCAAGLSEALELTPPPPAKAERMERPGRNQLIAQLGF